MVAAIQVIYLKKVESTPYQFNSMPLINLK